MPEPSLEQMLKLYTKKDLWERIQQLKQQLAEKEKEIEEYQKLINDTCNRFMVCSLNEITQNKTAIEELEKVVEFIKEYPHEPRYWDITSYIDQQIAQLKGEK